MPQALEWTQTALYKDGTTDLLKSMPPLVFMPMPDAPDGSPFLSIDASTTYQQILGFGGEHPPPRSHVPSMSTRLHAHLRLDSCGTHARLTSLLAGSGAAATHACHR